MGVPPHGVVPPPQGVFPLLQRSSGLMPPPPRLSLTSASPYLSQSLQVRRAPCWQRLVPDVLSTIRAEALGPIPRRDLPVPMPVASQETSASRHFSHVRLAGQSLHSNFDRGGSNGAAVIR